MPRYAAILLLGACIASADSLHDRIQQANGLLRSGESDKALDAYHEIQVDHPDAPVIDYNIGCAEYDKGLKPLQTPSKAPQQPDLTEALNSFEHAMKSDDPVVRESAAFNRATCLAQTAKNAPKEVKQSDKVQAYQNAIQAYEDVLRSNPRNEGAQQNIDNLRYSLKKELATPPPPPQQGKGDSDPQQQNQQDKQDNQSNQQNQTQQQDQRQQSDTQESQPQDKQDEQQSKASQNNPSQQRDDAKSRQEQAQDQNEQDATDKAQDEPKTGEQTEDDTTQPQQDRQTTEALLQSLENTDKQIQKNVRKGPMDRRPREANWW